MFWAAFIFVMLLLVGIGVYLGLKFNIGVRAETEVSGRTEESVRKSSPVIRAPAS